MKSREAILIVALVILLVTVSCYAISLQHESSNEGNERIGVIGAMEPEVEYLISIMDDKEVSTFSEMNFYSGKIHGKDVTVVQCGMGKVNAGICANLLINHFNVKAIINTGVAGSLSNELDIGDIVVSTDAVQHDFDVSPIGFEKGEIPYTGKYSFPADNYLVELADYVIANCITDVNHMTGRVCTGDQFVNTTEQKETITGNFGGLCCEMEGGAIAQVCYLNDTPFVIIRAVSDKADGTSPGDYEEFMKKAAKRSSMIVELMIETYGKAV